MADLGVDHRGGELRSRIQCANLPVTLSRPEAFSPKLCPTTISIIISLFQVC